MDMDLKIALPKKTFIATVYLGKHTQIKSQK